MGNRKNQIRSSKSRKKCHKIRRKPEKPKCLSESSVESMCSDILPETGHHQDISDSFVRNLPTDISGIKPLVNSTPKKRRNELYLAPSFDTPSPPLKLCRNTYDRTYARATQNDTSPGRKLIAEGFATNDDLQEHVLVEVGDLVEEHAGQKEDTNFELLINLGTTLNHLKEVFRHEYTCKRSGIMELMRKNHRAMDTTLTFKCNKCNIVKVCKTHTKEQTEKLNTATVLGTLSIGAGHSQAQELFANVGIHMMAFNTFAKFEEDLSQSFSKELADEIKENGELERRLAIENDQLCEDGTPYITVVGDGGWGVRSYSHSMRSPVGCGILIGARTGKLLYVGTKNKYCCICAAASKKGVDAREHKCYRNYSGTSTGMEQEIIVEGFCSSMKMHGVRYLYYVGDGDSSVMKRIREKCDYGNQVTKINCKNHMMRCFTSGLYGISMNRALKHPHLRKILRSNIDRLIKGVNGAIHRKTEMCAVEKSKRIPMKDIVKMLRDQLKSVPYHVFGDHQYCATPYCTRKNLDELEVNWVPEMQAKDCDIWSEVESRVQYLIANAEEINSKITTNKAECFMSINTKYQGAKRKCMARRNGYKTRTDLATLQFNKNNRWQRELWKRKFEESPNQQLKRVLASKILKRERDAIARKRLLEANPQEASRRKPRTVLPDLDCDYGETAREIDYPPEKMEKESKRKLAVQAEDVDSEAKRRKIMTDTEDQHHSARYRILKADRITASNFYKIVRLDDATDPHNTVKNLRNPPDLSKNSAVKYGLENEEKVKKRFTEKTGLEIKKIGLCVHEDWPYLGATPDGAIGENSIVEIKCLFSARDKMILDYVSERQGVDHLGEPIIENGKKKNKKQFAGVCLENKGGNLHMKKHHPYYYQVQGQLAITRKEKCYFIVATDIDMFYVEILPDPELWQEMSQKLKRFYLEVYLPEIINPRIPRGMIVRKPAYYHIAFKEKIKKMQEKKMEADMRKKEKEKLLEEKAKKAAELVLRKKQKEKEKPLSKANRKRKK